MNRRLPWGVTLLGVLCGIGATGCGFTDSGTGGRPRTEPTATADPAAMEHPRRVLLDLYASRLLANRELGGPLLEASSPSFVRAIRGGWKNAWLPYREHEGERVAFVAGLAGALDLPVGAHVASHLTAVELELKPFVAGQKLTIVVNEKAILNTAIPAPRWTRVRAPIPAGLIRAGENVVRLHFAKTRPVGTIRLAAAVRWLRLYTADAPPMPDGGLASVNVPAATIGGETLRALRLGRGGVAFYLQVPPDARLDMRLGIAAPASSEPSGDAEKPGGCTFVVRLERDGESPEELYRGKMEGTSARWVPASADLSTFAHTAVRLGISTEGSGCAGAMVASPALVTSGPLPASRATPAAAPEGPTREERPAPPQHIILWLVDSMRADRLGPYAATRVRTPAFNALSRDGVLFLRANAVASESRAVAASLFTGTYPARHGLVGGKGRITAATPTLAELLSRAGYTTAAFIGSGFLSAGDGFDRGFAEFTNFIREGNPTDAEGIWTAAREWLTAQAPARAFLYLHHIDPHVPYRAHDGLITLYDPLPYHGPYRRAVTGHHLAAFIAGRAPFAGRDRERAVALYDNEVAFNDLVFGKMMIELEELGFARDTLIVVASDHGEELWDHDGVGHAQTLYEEVLRTPLVWRRLGDTALPETRGRVVRELVDTIDLMPSLLEVAGIDPPATLQGQSFAPTRAGAPGGPGTFGVTYASHLGFWRAARIGRLKCHIRGLVPRLYDLDEDPTETTDRWADRPVAARACADVLWLLVRYGDSWKKTEFGTPAAHTEVFAATAESGALE